MKIIEQKLGVMNISANNNAKALMLMRGQQTFSRMPEEIVKLGELFTKEGEELALVGGPVRDAFLGKPIHDYDFTTSARPDVTQKILNTWGNTWDIGKEFGTIGAQNAGYTVEITTYRTDEYDMESRKPEVTYGDTLEGDLTRRDFTVNAMAIRLPNMHLVDPCNGLDDLERYVLRTPVNPAQSFDDDPLRIMRAARFAAQLGFDISPDVLRAMEDFAPRLEIVSRERIQSELKRLITSPQPRRGIEALVHTGIADVVLPEISMLKNTVDAHHRHKDVYEHTLQVLDNAIALEDDELPGPDFVLRFAALMHDIGKPKTRKFEKDGSVTFRWHDVVGAKMATQRMKELRFDKKTTQDVARLVELHLRAFGFADSGWTDSAVRRFVKDAGPLLSRLLRLIRADITSQNRRKVNILQVANDELERRIIELREKEELDAVRPDIDGNEIMEILGISPGRTVGEAYKYMLNIRLEEGPLEHDEAAKRLKKWWAER